MDNILYTLVPNGKVVYKCDICGKEFLDRFIPGILCYICEECSSDSGVYHQGNDL